MTTGEIETNYEEYYRKRTAQRVYPVEFVVRAFLGTYPRLKTDPSALRGARALDLGFGDGRNVPLLADLGMEPHGVELTEEICLRAVARMKNLGIAFEARVGRNNAIPYADQFFDHVVACHSCYYIDDGTCFSDNLSEIARVMRPGGVFVHSLPMPSTYILADAIDLGDGHVRIRSDPYGVRNNYVFRKFDSVEEISTTLRPYFSDVRVGSCRNDWWGIEEHVWIVVCTRR